METLKSVVVKTVDQRHQWATFNKPESGPVHIQAHAGMRIVISADGASKNAATAWFRRKNNDLEVRLDAPEADAAPRAPDSIHPAEPPDMVVSDFFTTPDVQIGGEIEGRYAVYTPTQDALIQAWSALPEGVTVPAVYGTSMGVQPLLVADIVAQANGAAAGMALAGVAAAASMSSVGDAAPAPAPAPAPTVGIDQVATDDNINASEKAAGVVVSGTTTAQDGQVLTLVWGSATKLVVVAAGVWSTRFDPAEIPADTASSVITASFNEATGRASRTVAINTAVPSLSIHTVATDNKINATEKTVGVTVSGTSTAEDGQTVTVTWGSTTKSVSVLAGAWTSSFSSAEIPADAANSTIVANVTNLAGNAATPAARTVLVDTLAPDIAIATVAADDKINAAEKAAGVAVSGSTTAENGQTVTVTWGTTSKQVSVSAGAWTSRFTSAEMAADPSSTITAHVSDAAGNAATPASRAVSFDADAPTLTIDPVAANDRISAAKKTAGVTVSGTTTAEDGQTVMVVWGSSIKRVNVLAQAWTSSFASNEIPADASASPITANVSDAAGNPATQASRVVAIDTTPPVVVVNTVASDNTIGATEKAAGVVVSGSTSAEDGQTVTVTWGSTQKQAAVLAGAWSCRFENNEIEVVAGSTITATVMDVATNAAVPAVQAVAFDMVPPTITIDSVATDDIVTATEKTAGVTVSGTTTAEDGQTVTVTWGATSKQVSVSSGTWTSSFASAEVPADAASSTITADVRDAAGNAATQASRVVAIDTQAPSISIGTVSTDDKVNAAEKTAGVTVSGTTTAETGQTVTVTWGVTSKQVSVSSGTWTSNFSSAEIPADATSSTIIANVRDAAGNAATQASRVVAIDTLAPSITIGTVSTDDKISAAEKTAGVTVSGTTTAENGQTVTVAWGSTTKSVSVLAGAWTSSFSSAEIPADAASSPITANVSDAAGNAATQANRTVVIDTTVSPATLSSTIVTNAGDVASIAPGGSTKDNTMGFSGTVETGGTVRIYNDSFSGGSSQLIASSVSGESNFISITGNNWQTGASEAKYLPNGTNNLRVVYSDVLGNSSTDSFTITVDVAPPSTNLVQATLTNNGDSFEGRASESADLYLINTTAKTASVTSKALVEALADDQWNKVSHVYDAASPTQNTFGSTTGLAPGTYKLWAVDAAGNLTPDTGYQSSTQVTIVNGYTLGSATVGGVNVTDWNLMLPVTVAGNAYYVVDVNGDGTITSADRLTHAQLDSIFNAGADTTTTNGTRTSSALLPGKSVLLPTQSQLQSIWTQVGAGHGWGAAINNTWAADLGASADIHKGVNLATGATFSASADTNLNYLVFQVL